MSSLGDFDASTVVYGKFTTFRPSTGAPFTLAGTPALSVYKDASTTQSTTGVTLTVDFDTVTGLNHFAIDTSADGTFYSAGSFFDVVITTGTVDSVSSVGAKVASFTIRKNSALKPATAGRTLVVDAAGLADANAVKVGPTGSGTAQTARDLGASVLLSPGTGAGQLSITSGVVSANTTQLSGQTVTAAAGVTFPTSVASPTNITAGTLTTVTNLTNLPSIPAGWLTATGIAAGALNGKGDWNTTTPPTTSAIAAAILATPANLLVTDASGRVLLQPTQTGVTIPTVTNLTNLPSIPANWITASGIATDAIGSAQIAASAVTEIQTGLATSTVQTSQGVQISWLQNFLGGDKSIDTATTPWNEVVKIAGTGTELIRKKLRDVTGANITTTTVVIGSAKDA